MAVIVDKKVKIVDAGALKHYVKLLSPEYDKKIRETAADGLWTLAFECRDEINDCSGCREGSYLSTVIFPMKLTSFVHKTRHFL